MEPPVANCFREISEFDDAGEERPPPMGAAEEKMLMSDAHSTINIGLSQASCK